MTTASGARNALPAVFAITFAKATALSSAAPLVYWLIPARPKMPTSSLVPAARRSRLHDLRHRDRALRLYAGLSDTSGTLVAVPSVTYLTWLAVVWDVANRSANWTGSNSFETTPGS